MPEPTYSVLQVLPGLERTLRAFFPRLEFYLGEDEKEREAQPPKVVWEIDGGDPTGLIAARPSSGLADPRPYAADWVGITARCVGAAQPTAVDTERTMRRQEFAASEQIVAVLRWALVKSDADGWLGEREWLGWTPLWPEGPGDRGCPIEAQFRVRLSYLAPARPIAEPPLTEEFFPVEIVTG